MIIELLQPVYGNEAGSVRSLSAYLGNETADLDVTFSIEVRNGRFVVAIDGEDEEICRNFLYAEFGKPMTPDDLFPGAVVRGYISKIEEDRIIVSCGTELAIPASALKPLGAGNAGQIAARFGMIPYQPVSFVVGDDMKTAAFTKEQVDLWWSWLKSPTDRLILNNATRSQVKAALKKKGHGRDVYGVEKLGLLESVIVCKEKTDGPGIVASVGKLLKSNIGVIIGTKK